MKHDCIHRLVDNGIALDDAVALRRIAMTLHRWHELECGDGNEWGSWCISRGRKENREFVYDDDGVPFIERHSHHGEARATYHPIPDREKGARKRLAKIMARYPGWTAYVQGDPRGASLYVLRPGDVRDGDGDGDGDGDVSCVYTRGIAVYK